VASLRASIAAFPGVSIAAIVLLILSFKAFKDTAIAILNQRQLATAPPEG
jgi:hypothetical protein